MYPSRFRYEAPRSLDEAISGAAAAMVGCVVFSRPERSSSACRHSAPMCKAPSGSARW